MIETGVFFNDIHSYYDLNLVLSKAEISPAIPKTNYIDIPGGDGSLDLTEALGAVKYGDRTLKFTFTVHPQDRMTFDEKCTQISNALNGLKCQITLDRDAEYYWDGRCTVDSYAQDGRLKQLVVSAKVRPYKLKQSLTALSFALSEEAAEISLKNGRKTAIPEITCTDDNTTVIFGSNTFTMNAGTQKFLDICLKEGGNALTISGSGTITFTYQEGEL